MGEMADFYIEQHLDAFPDDELFVSRRSSRPRVNSAKVWKTKEGKLLDIDTMEESHMINCIRLCIKNHMSPPARMLTRLKASGVTFDIIVNNKGELT